MLQAVDRDRRTWHLASIAFPGISTGLYGYPAKAAADESLAAVVEALHAPGPLERVLFCCFSEPAATVYVEAMRRAGFDPPRPVPVAAWP